MSDGNGKTRATVAVLQQQLQDMKEQNAKDTARVEGKIDALTVANQTREDRFTDYFITRREHEAAIKEVNAKIGPVIKLIYGVIMALLVALIGLAFTLFGPAHQTPQVTTQETPRAE